MQEGIIEMAYGCTINVAFSSLSFSELSVNPFISDFIASFSAIIDSTLSASSSVSACADGCKSLARPQWMQIGRSDQQHKSREFLSTKIHRFLYLLPQPWPPSRFSIRLFPPLSFQLPFILSNIKQTITRMYYLVREGFRQWISRLWTEK